MSKGIAFTVLFSVMTAAGGWLASCGASSDERFPVVVQMPHGCGLESPRPMNDLGSDDAIVNLKSGSNRLRLDCNGQAFEVDKQIGSGQTSLAILADELRQAR